MEASPTVSEIYKIIIPAVVARLELAKYSLYQHPPNNSGKKGSSQYSSQDDYESMGKQVEKLTNDLSYIKSFLKNLDNSIYSYKSNILVNFKGNATVFVNALLRCSQLFDNFGITNRKDQAKLRALTKVVLKMKYQLSLSNIETFDARNWYIEVMRENDFSLQEVLDSSDFRLFQEVYESLELTTKLCLLCFAIIPENEVVMKRFMRHWWVGEGFVGPPVEETVDGILQELVNKGCIEPVNDEYRFVADRRYRMDPSIRWAVIVLAKEAGFFDFDYDGNPTANSERSYSSRACLVNGFSHEEFLKRENKLDLVQTIINVNEVFLPDLFKSEWFSKLKNVKVLYLGRWQTSAMHHIEVESVEFLKGLKSMKLLRFFSLQGISMITKLPDSVCKLLNLRILDLRACHNLELLPDGIGSLEKLTHLDISECYLLDDMPKGIARLSELQVLKGFVISDIFGSESCTLDELLELKNLRKLNIYIKTKHFRTDTKITTVYKFKKLQKLTITWGAAGDHKETQGLQVVAQPDAETTSPLEKLGLECYPCTTAPGWLLPGKFPKLKKLYIRGGNLQNLTPKFPNVEVLRLKFLSDLKMDWKKLRSSFPGLICLEIFKCPKLTYVPCTTDNGVVWL